MPTTTDLYKAALGVLQHAPASDDARALAELVISTISATSPGPRPPFGSDGLMGAHINFNSGAMDAIRAERDALLAECLAHEANDACDREVLLKTKKYHADFVARLADHLGIENHGESGVEHAVKCVAGARLRGNAALTRSEVTITELRRSIDAMYLIAQNAQKA